MAYDKSLAHIEQIKTITPIVGADNIEMVSVLDWNIVAKKGEFKINDLALFIEVDSIVPDGVPDEKKDELKTLYDELSIAEKDKRLDIETKLYAKIYDIIILSEFPQFEFLRKRKFKIKAVKYNKFNIISQGIVFKPSDFNIENPKVGMDCTELLKIEHIIEDVEESGVIEIKNPILKIIDKKLMRYKIYRNWKKQNRLSNGGWLSIFPNKSDEENAQKIFSHMKKYHNDEEWIVTEKLEGQNITIWSKTTKHLLPFLKSKKSVSVCSRTRNLPFVGEKDSQFWKTVRRLGYDKIIASIPGNWFCRGEHVGPGIQDNIYKLPSHEIRFFDFYEFMPDNTKRKLNYEESIQFSKKWNLPFVPVLDENFKLPENADDLLSYSNGNTIFGNNLKQIREGVVLRLRNNYEVSFKARSPKYICSKDSKSKKDE